MCQLIDLETAKRVFAGSREACIREAGLRLAQGHPCALLPA